MTAGELKRALENVPNDYAIVIDCPHGAPLAYRDIAECWPVAPAQQYVLSHELPADPARPYHRAEPAPAIAPAANEPADNDATATNDDWDSPEAEGYKRGDPGARAAWFNR